MSQSLLCSNVRAAKVAPMSTGHKLMKIHQLSSTRLSGQEGASGCEPVVEAEASARTIHAESDVSVLLKESLSDCK